LDSWDGCDAMLRRARSERASDDAQGSLANAAAVGRCLGRRRKRTWAAIVVEYAISSAMLLVSSPSYF
jgi:hypothetical protein